MLFALFARIGIINAGNPRIIAIAYSPKERLVVPSRICNCGMLIINASAAREIIAAEARLKSLKTGSKKFLTH